MLCFGFWPSLIYLLIMIIGAILFNYNNEVNFPSFNYRPLFNKTSFILSNKLPRFNLKTINLLVKTTLITVLGFIIIVFIVSWAMNDYIKKRDTRNDCVEIVAALNNYYKVYNFYPDKLEKIINTNPMRQAWYRDYWNNNYYYKTENGSTHFVLISAGKDRKLNTEDDMIFKDVSLDQQ